MSGKKKNKIPKGPEYFDAPLIDSGGDLDHDDEMRVSVSWAQVGAGADDVLGGSAGADIDVDTDQNSAFPSGQQEQTHDLDEVPVTGAPHKTFESLLEESLASGEDPRGATPDRGGTPKAPTGVSAPRPFLKRGARSQRTVAPVKSSVSGTDQVKTKSKVDSHRVVAKTKSEKAPSSVARRSYAASYLDSSDSKFGYDDSETTNTSKNSKASKHTPSKASTAVDELAEFEALERELFNDSNQSSQPVGKQSGDDRNTSSKSSTAAERNATRKAKSMSSMHASLNRQAVEKLKLAAAMKSVRLDSDNDSVSDDGFGIEDHFGEKRSSPMKRHDSKSTRPPAPSSPTPPAFDDGDSWDDDHTYGVGAKSPINSRNNSWKVLKPSPSKPGEGAPALIKSLFYGADGAGGKNVTKKTTSSNTKATTTNASAAQATLDAAAAQEAAAAARDASDAVRRERERLERDKVSFLKEKRLFARERQQDELKLGELHAVLEGKQQTLDATAERVKRDRQRLDRESRRAAESTTTTKKERVEIDDLKKELARVMEEAKIKDSKHKASQDRLRRQITDFRDEVQELKGEKRRLEQQILGFRSADESGGRAAKPKKTDESRRERELREREAREARELRERRDREEIEELAREQRERRAAEEQRDRELLQRDDETTEEGEGYSSSDSDTSERDDVRLSAHSRGLGGSDVAKSEFHHTQHDVVGVGVAEAAAAHMLPSVRDAPPRVGPPPDNDGASLPGPVDVNQHEDGRVERVTPHGRRVVKFTNGTLKDVTPSAEGPISTVYFTNGDVKRAHPGGRVEYFYKEVDTWHTTHPEGVEVYHFPSGQTEAHGVDGRKEILFPDGLLRRVYPDGREEDEPRGSVVTA